MTFSFRIWDFTILFTVAALYVVVFITSFLQERMMTVVAQKTTYRLSNALKK